MKIKELRELSLVEIQRRTQELQTEALNLRIKQKIDKLDNPARLTQIRREIARLQTIATERTNA
jgi:large subunit ribosomal protein L29